MDNVSSKSLIRAFGWERPVPGLVLAVQLVALSKKFEVYRATRCSRYFMTLFFSFLSVSVVSHAFVAERR